MTDKKIHEESTWKTDGSHSIEETWNGTCSECGGVYVYRKKFEGNKPVSNTDIGQHAYKSQCDQVKRDKKREKMKKGKKKHLEFIVPFFKIQRKMSMCAKNASKYRKYLFADSSKDMNCKKCYWQLFKLGLMTEEAHADLKARGLLHERFEQWERWTDIA